MTQTAVTFLAGKIAELNTLHINNRIDLNQFQLLFNEAYQQAKEMEYKQSMDSMQKGMELQEKENYRVGFRERNNLLSSQTEISDEKIENCVGDGMHDFYKGGFIEGAKWYREQLKQRQ